MPFSRFGWLRVLRRTRLWALAGGSGSGAAADGRGTARPQRAQVRVAGASDERVGVHEQSDDDE